VEYLNRESLRKLFTVAYESNSHYHLALTVSLWHATRVSEMLAIRASDVQDGSVRIRGLKGSNTSFQPVRIDPDLIFDCSGLITRALGADSSDSRIFPWCRQRMDQIIKEYGQKAGIDPAACHMHAIRHSLAMLLWDATGGSLGLVQRHLRHKSASSTLVYLYEVDSRKASAAVQGIRI
jgi:integrase